MIVILITFIIIGIFLMSRFHIAPTAALFGLWLVIVSTFWLTFGLLFPERMYYEWW